MIEIQSFRGFIFKDCLLSTLVLYMHCDCLIKFSKDLIQFVDDKLPTKAAKITKICKYIYGIFIKSFVVSHMHCTL